LLKREEKETPCSMEVVVEIAWSGGSKEKSDGGRDGDEMRGRKGGRRGGSARKGGKQEEREMDHGDGKLVYQPKGDVRGS
jgi:hypothetical protein